VTILTLLRRAVKPGLIKMETGASFSTIRRVKELDSAEQSQRTSLSSVRTPEFLVQVAQKRSGCLLHPIKLSSTMPSGIMWLAYLA